MHCMILAIWSALVLKMVVLTGSEAFKRRLVYSTAVAIASQSNFVSLFISFIANVLKYKARII